MKLTTKMPNVLPFVLSHSVVQIADYEISNLYYLHYWINFEVSEVTQRSHEAGSERKHSSM